MDKQRSHKEYETAKKIIKILVSEGIIKGNSSVDNYLNTWNAAFAILDLLSAPKGE